MSLKYEPASEPPAASARPCHQAAWKRKSQAPPPLWQTARPPLSRNKCVCFTDVGVWGSDVRDSGGEHRRQHRPVPATRRFRGGLVFKAHRLVYHPPLGLRVIKRKKEACECGSTLPLLLLLDYSHNWSLCSDLAWCRTRESLLNL